MRRIFIVEDDPAVRDALFMVIADAGFEVSAFPDGDTFLAEEDTMARDVILLDMDLPGLSGAQVATALRARGSQARIAVISGLRAHAFDENVRQIAPMAAFRKPLDPDLLLATLATP